MDRSRSLEDQETKPSNDELVPSGQGNLVPTNEIRPKDPQQQRAVGNKKGLLNKST